MEAVRVLDAKYEAQAKVEEKSQAAGAAVRHAVKVGSQHSVASSKVAGSAVRGFVRGLLGK